MVLAIGVTFQIIEALLKAIDSMKKKKCMIIDQKQITVAENKLLVLKKYVPRNNSPDQVYTWSWGLDKFLQRHGKIGKQAYLTGKIGLAGLVT